MKPVSRSILNAVELKSRHVAKDRNSSSEKLSIFEKLNFSLKLGISVEKLNFSF